MDIIILANLAVTQRAALSRVSMPPITYISVTGKSVT